MKFALLSLLTSNPAHGYDLRSDLEAGFGGLWESVNGGQVYTTLARLERDGLVSSFEADDADGRGKRTYTITDDGQDELRKWLTNGQTEPVVGGEVFRKLVIARETGLADPAQLLDTVRADALNRLAAIRRGPASDETTDLLLHWVARRLEADLEWIEYCEQWLERPPDLT